MQNRAPTVTSVRRDRSVCRVPQVQLVLPVHLVLQEPTAIRVPTVTRVRPVLSALKVRLVQLDPWVLPCSSKPRLDRMAIPVRRESRVWPALRALRAQPDPQVHLVPMETPEQTETSALPDP